MNRAITAVTIRSVNEEKRQLSGWATVPDVDRVGDIVDPFGATFAASVPLLVGHDHQLPVGRVTFGKPTAKGIPFEATLPKIAESGPLKDRVDSAWLAAKYKLIDSVSIGFRVIGNAVERIETGLKYLRYEIMELSLVSVPAAPGARITATRSANHVVRLSEKRSGVVRISQREIELQRFLATSKALRQIRMRLGFPPGPVMTEAHFDWVEAQLDQHNPGRKALRATRERRR